MNSSREGIFRIFSLPEKADLFDWISSILMNSWLGTRWNREVTRAEEKVIFDRLKSLRKAVTTEGAKRIGKDNRISVNSLARVSSK